MGHMNQKYLNNDLLYDLNNDLLYLKMGHMNQ